MRKTLLVLSSLVAAPALAAEQVMLVLDASGSMWGQIEGRSKMDIAREAVEGLITRWKPQDQIGLMAYGHRRKGDCSDIELLLGPAALDAAAFRSRVGALTPTGMTPLSAAVIQAADVLKSSEQKATVILISDGEETCNLDPCQVGRELEKKGVDFTANVIGFDIANPLHQAQLRCLAENTGGQYFNARDAASLAGSLSAAIAASTEPKLPPATASLSAPERAPMVTRIQIAFEGPRDDGAYIGVYPSDRADAAELHYAWIKDASAEGSVSLDLPAEAGHYELRYVSPLREPRILARRPIEVTASSVSVSGPAQAVAGSTIQIKASGPIDGGHWIGFAEAGSGAESYLDYVRPEEGGSSYEVRTPVKPGAYELRYVLNERESIAARQAIRIVAASASIEAPAEVRTGAQVQIRARAPLAKGNWIGFAPAGSSAGTYLQYEDISAEDASYTLTAPDEPGDYELRIVLYTADTVVASVPIKVLP